ncbi:LPXTG cell wall anchor domain-containing protein [Streptococcus suis]|uniref:LPXTG cell wall anchor domain-containing protein n=1 Tax=Streptococcus suis TaxID=1307 RepID=UPI0028A92291|nr:LPXTG cell wall anchor domain-containing protein [Streptococcus suis]WNN03170.1 LPXTG cell wall anchor domain-containing protein [Streptococcus suis]WNO81079.1 LPXTG cell wall anchor domain-containing protein [Streptococcus suis]HEL2418017.1 LPXTG cell wall anchor domain-containing protein [Streptococcus suis]HEM3991812.1 LPXTG cell wall anchor domain-containing protein [Streptococcus suis]HEM3997482.1 LPXTG cell wall anchor domain-containing protein [Streptococcus suis]
MSKQKVISGLLLSTTVLGGLLLYPTSLVKAEGTELTEVAVTEAPKSNSEEISVTSENSPSPVLEEAVMVADNNPSTNAESSLKEEEDKKENVDLELVSNEELVSLSESKNVVEGEEARSTIDTDVIKNSLVEKQELIQETNKSDFFGSKELFEKSVEIVAKNVDSGEIEWEVTFDAKNWSFSREHGGYYFSTPKGVQIIEFSDALGRDLLKNYNSSGTDGSKYRLFKDGESGFSDQWGWSVGLTDSNVLRQWKTENRFSNIYYLDYPRDTDKVTYRLKGKILDKSLKNISLVAVMKNFDHQNHLFKQIVSVAGLELTLKKLEQVNPNTEKPEKKAPSVPEVDKETEAPIEGLKPKDKITVTVKGGENSEITDLDFRYYIYQGNFQRTISAGTTLAEFLKEIAIKEAPLDNDRKPNDVILKQGYKVSKWVDDKNNVIQSDTVLSNGMSLTPIVEPKEKPESTPAPQPETPKSPSTPEKPMVDPKASETEKPGTPEQPKMPSVPEQPEVPAPSPSPESPKKEDMAPNKTKDEIYEPIVQTDKWVVYPVGTSKEEAEKKILDAVTVPEKAGFVTKEIVGDVPLAAGQYGVNVKVIYDDKSYDVTLVDVHVTSNQTDKQNEDMPRSPEQSRMSEMPKVEPKVEEMQPKVMPQSPEMPSPAPEPEQPKTPEVPDMSQPEVPKSETPKMEQPEVVPPTSESEQPQAPMKPETSSPEGPEMPRVPETPEVVPPTPAPEQPRVPEMPDTPAPESPKKEEMVPNKTKDELYEPIVSMVDWVAYPVGTSKEVAEKKILDAVTVPQEAGPITKEIVGEVPLVEGQYGVNVKVIYDDHSYDIALVDVKVTNEKSHMDMPQPEVPKKETPKKEQPEMVIPEDKMPEVDNPKQDTPKLEQPKVETPKEEAPKKEIPQTETPKIEVPKESEKEKSDIQKMAKPKQEDQMAKESQKTDNPSEKMRPESQGAKTTSPAVKQPMTEMSDGKKSQKSKETLPNTGEVGGSLTWLGAVLATLSTFVYVFKNKKKEE